MTSLLNVIDDENENREKMNFVKDESGFGVCEVVTPEELDVYIGYRNKLFPEQPTNMEETLLRDKARPKDKFHVRRLLTWEGEVVCCQVLVEAFWQTKENYFEAMGGMLTEDTELLDRLVATTDDFLIRKGATTLATWQNDRSQAVLDAFERAGYNKTNCNPETELDLKDFDDAPYVEMVSQLEKSDLEVKTLKEFMESNPEDWLVRYWDAEWEFMQDVPLPFELKRDSLEVFAGYIEAQKHDWDWVLLVLDGREIVATSGAGQNKVDPRLFKTGLTATRRSYRRRGIATAIKVINLRRMREAGGEIVGTDNEENNPMLDLNIQLGFRHARNWYGLEKKI